MRNNFEKRRLLATAYRVLALREMDDGTYTHLSIRAAQDDSFFIAPFGLLFEEVRPEHLLRVSFGGEVLENGLWNVENYLGRVPQADGAWNTDHATIARAAADAPYNQTGYVAHGGLYAHRPNLGAIFHLHTPATVAVSAMQCGLLPMSQHALHFYERVAYHPYRSLALSWEEHAVCLARDLGKHYVMLLQHHGTITAGRTIQEAMFYTHHLEQACRIQCMALLSGHALVPIDPELCAKSCHDLLHFEGVVA